MIKSENQKYIEEKVFSIDGLRLIILSYYLDPPHCKSCGIVLTNHSTWFPTGYKIKYNGLCLWCYH